MIIGLDVGGTHTDVVLLDNQGLRKEIKVPTDASDLFGSVLAGLTAITEGIDPETVDRLVLSTTLTTNAVVQHQTPPVGMIVSSGPGIDPEFYRTNAYYYAVAGSIDHRGREVEPIDTGEIEKIIDALKKEGIRYVGVVGKFSTRNPAHELEIYRILNNDFDKVFLGHRVSGNLNFGRRIATAFLNASVYPLHKEFYRAVQQSLESRGLKLPLRLLKADGGNMNFDTSIEYPAQTILSGPAASVMGGGTQSRRQCHGRCGLLLGARRHPGDGYRWDHNRHGGSYQKGSRARSPWHKSGPVQNIDPLTGDLFDWIGRRQCG